MSTTMVPTQYIETVALGDVPAYLEESCVSYCDLEAENRCKTGVEIAPGLAPSSFRDSIIVYMDSTRKKYISRVEYTTKMKPKSYSETNYMRPKAVCRTFASMVDYHAEGTRKWYKTMVQLEPKRYNSSQEVRIGETSKKSEVDDSNDVTLDSMGYASDDNSLGDPLSPLRLQEGQKSPLDEDYRDKSPRSRRRKEEVEAMNGENENGKYHRVKSRDSGYGASDIYESHWDQNTVTTHRSGPFIYNAPKERMRKYVEPLEDDFNSQEIIQDSTQEIIQEKQLVNGNGDMLNGDCHSYNGHSPRINGYSYDHNGLDDLVDL